MSRLVTALLLLSVATIPVAAQKKAITSSKSTVARKCTGNNKLIDHKRSSVYLTFLKHETMEPADKGDESEYLFFTFTNNSCWPEWLKMSGVSNERHGDVSLYYLIENSRSGEQISGRLYCHVCSINPVSPGNNLTYSIPLRDAKQNTRMRIGNQFDWERDASQNDTEHTVSYYFSRLPQTVLRKILPEH
ncbi:MAG: hypothetical protein KF881_01065 [Acidobacteria bacterium]|nr:hypothetical protein [Acidobacteriota bacterium]